MKPKAHYWLNLTAMTALSLTLALFIIVIYASNRWMQSYLYSPQNNLPRQLRYLSPFSLHNCKPTYAICNFACC
jgi:hypothetical protein